MNEVWRQIRELDLFGGQALGAALLGGLLLFAVAVVLFMGTRWGQAQPLSKCIFLSFFAHALFLGYAWGTRMIVEAPRSPERYVRLNSVEIDNDQQGEIPGDAGFADEPWNDFPSENSAAPSLERLAPAAAPAADHVTLAVNRALAEITAPRVAYQPAAPTAEETAIVRPEPAAPQAVLAVKESPIDPTHMPAPPRQRETSPTITPHIPELSRQPAPEADPILVTRSTQVELPQALADPSAALQRIAESAANAEDGGLQAAPVDQAEPTLKMTDESPIAAGGSSPAESREPEQPAATPPSTLQFVRRNQELAAAPSTMAPAVEAALATHAPRRLGDGGALPDMYRLRVTADRVKVAEQFGGGPETEAAVEAALVWLAEHQEADGRWQAAKYGAGRDDGVLGQQRGGAGAKADTGVTGLALLAFFGAGQSHMEGDYQVNVQKGLEFLLGNQSPDGCLAGDTLLYEKMYCHGMASLAVSEALALTGDQRLKPFVQKAVAYTVKAQSKVDGGWRYQPGDSGDLSQFGWQVMALKSAHLAGVPTPEATRGKMLHFLKRVTSGEHGGLGSYRPDESPSRSMTAEALACRYFLESKPQPATVDEAIAYIRQDKPGSGKPNYYYWYYATIGLYQSQGEAWNEWNAALTDDLLTRQLRGGANSGSWNPDSVWGGYGGRVYTTAMAALCLEVYYRYLPLYGYRIAEKPEKERR